VRARRAESQNSSGRGGVGKHGCSKEGEKQKQQQQQQQQKQLKLCMTKNIGA